MTPLRAKWFNTKTGIVGIVYAADDFGKEDYFIGVAQGMHEPIDIANIANIGTLFPLEVGDLLFGVTREPAKQPAARVPRVVERPKTSARVQPVEDKKRPRKPKAD
jgi:hypothetical protein